MDFLMRREVEIYYMMLLVIPIASAFVILTAILIGLEWILQRASVEQSVFKGLRSIAGEVKKCVLRGALLGGIMSVLGVLPGLCVAWLVFQDADVQMLKVAAPVSTLIGLSSSILLFLFRKGAFRKIVSLSWPILQYMYMFIPDDEISLVNYRRALIWRLLGWLLGSFWPVICTNLLLRYPY